MAWYKTGTVAVAATKVTGTGTNFLDAKFGIGPGQAFLLPASGTVKIYEIASVEDATHLTLTTTAGTVAAGAAYAVMSFYTDSIPDFSKRLAAQLGYYQSQMDGWQQIMTGSGTIGITAPDGTVVNISSFAKLTSDMTNTIQSKGRPSAAGYADVNSIGPIGNGLGIWSLDNAANYGLLNVPEASPGYLEVFSSGSYNGSQRYTTRTGHVYNRTLTAAWSAASPNVWSAWTPLIATGDYGLGGLANSATDLSSMFNGGWYYATTAVSQAAGLPARGHSIQVTPSASNGFTVQQAYPSTSVAGIQNKIYIRSFASGAWSDWFEALTVTSGGALPIANGGTGATTAAAARAALGAFSSAGGAVSGSLTAGAAAGLAVAAGENNRVEINNVTSGGGVGNPIGWTVYRWYNELAQTGIRRAGDTTIQSYFVALSAGGGWEFLRGGNATASGTWTSGSDIRHKFDIEKVKNALASVLTFNGSIYGKKDGGREVGLIAQDVERACKEAITYNGDRKFSDGTVIPNFKYLNTAGAAAAYHTEAIKTLFELVELALDKPDDARALIASIKEQSEVIKNTPIENEDPWKEAPPIYDVPSSEDYEEPST